MIIAAISIPVVLFSLWVISGYLPTMNIKSPAYRVLETGPDYEVRRYESFVTAETPRKGSPSSSGFNELFQYISGNNVSRAKIPMTAPVLRSSKAGGEKIPMTAPVLRQMNGGSEIIAFAMPPGSKLEDLPRPKSTNVTLKTVPPHKVAVITFSGSATESSLRQHTEKLLAALERDGRPAQSAPCIALYNPPWTPPFMRRNEVMVEIA
jgi:hypothetical protein